MRATKGATTVVAMAGLVERPARRGDRLPAIMNLRRVFIAATAAGALVAPALHAAQLQLSTGAEYSKGDYGEIASTEAFVVPFSARVSFGSFSLRASIPWLAVRGPADIAPVVDDNGGDRGSNSGSGSSGSGGSGSSGSGSSGSGSSGSGGGDDDDDELEEEDDDRDFPDDRKVQGMGDATVSVAWGFRDIGGTRLYVDVTGRVRLPTGDKAGGLGRGTTDYATLAEMGWDGKRGGVFVLGGRQYLESTTAVKRRDTWQGSAGGWVNVGRASLVGVQGNWREASTASGVESKSVDLFLNLRIAEGWRLDVNGGAGLSRAASDYAVGLGVTWRSTRR